MNANSAVPLQDRVEAASINAWPALETTTRGVALLRFANGYTKRANSATLLSDSVDHTALIADCEHWFKARAAPCIFRIPSLAHAHAVDEALAERGYRLMDKTFVMGMPLTSYLSDPAPGRANLGASQRIDDWLAHYQELHDLGQHAAPRHAAILHAIKSARFLGTLFENHKPVSCGLAVCDDGLLGLFDLVTAKPQRGRGLGTQLLNGLFAWGTQRGAHYAYLQVVKSNEAAVRLYRRLGFERLYDYWYRVR